MIASQEMGCKNEKNFEVVSESGGGDWALTDGVATMTLFWHRIEQMLLYRPKVVWPRPKKKTAA